MKWNCLGQSIGQLRSLSRVSWEEYVTQAQQGLMQRKTMDIHHAICGIGIDISRNIRGPRKGTGRITGIPASGARAQALPGDGRSTSKSSRCSSRVCSDYSMTTEYYGTSRGSSFLWRGSQVTAKDRTRVRDERFDHRGKVETLGGLTPRSNRRPNSCRKSQRTLRQLREPSG